MPHSRHRAESCLSQVISGLSKPSYSKWQLQHAFRLLSTEQAPAHHISRAALQHHLVSQLPVYLLGDMELGSDCCLTSLSAQYALTLIGHWSGWGIPEAVSLHDHVMCGPKVAFLHGDRLVDILLQATLCSKDPREVERLMRPLGQGAALNYHAVTAQYL